MFTLSQIIVFNYITYVLFAFFNAGFFIPVNKNLWSLYRFQGYINVLSRPVVISRSKESVWTNVYVDSSVRGRKGLIWVLSLHVLSSKRRAVRCSFLRTDVQIVQFISGLNKQTLLPV